MNKSLCEYLISSIDLSHFHSTTDFCDWLSVLGHRCKSEEAKKLPTSDEEHIYAADTCGVANDIRLTLMQRFFKDVGVYENITSFTPEREKLKTLEVLLMIWIFMC